MLTDIERTILELSKKIVDYEIHERNKEFICEWWKEYFDQIFYPDDSDSDDPDIFYSHDCECPCCNNKIMFCDESEITTYGHKKDCFGPTLSSWRSGAVPAIAW